MQSFLLRQFAGVILLESDSLLGKWPFSCTFCYPDLGIRCIWCMYQPKDSLKPFSLLEKETCETLWEKLKANHQFQGISSTMWQTFTGLRRRQNTQMPSESMNRAGTILHSAKGTTRKSIYSTETLPVSSVLGKSYNFPHVESHKS